MENYISVPVASTKKELSKGRIYTPFPEGCMPKAVDFRGSFGIANDGTKPADAVINHGKYRGYSKKYSQKIKNFLNREEK
ncbi:MAG: hypothetical protein RR385_09235 [Clostridiales bacterium]